MPPRFSLLALALAASLAGTGAGAQDAPRPPSVTVTLPERSTLRETVLLTGTFVAREEILVAPELEGVAIVEVLAEEGDRVAQGQVLARLSRETLDVLVAQNGAQIARTEAAIAQARAQIVEAEAARVQAQQSLARTRSLVPTGSTTQEILDQRVAAARGADARLDSARQALALAEADRTLMQAQRRELDLRLSRTEVRARAAGIVSRRSARVGAMAAGAADAMFRIIADGIIELEADVVETVLARLRPGQQVEVEAIGREDRSRGAVRLVAPEVARQTRLGRVRIALAEGASVALGTFGRAQVEVARAEGLTVPLSAVAFNASGATVQVVREGVVETRRVVTGIRAEGRVEIREGLGAQDRVVATAGTFLRHGDRVTPVEAPPRQASR